MALKFFVPVLRITSPDHLEIIAAHFLGTKLRLSVCSFLGFSSVEVKSDDRYQIGRRISSDNHRPLLYHVISFIR